MTRSRSPVISTRTNSEDPKMLNARVFIGNLPTDKVTQQDIDDMYKKYGRILGVSLFHRFGFVQFEREEDARKAVEMEAGSLVKGELVDVKMAGEGRRNPPMSRGRGRGRGGPPRYPAHSRSPREPLLERERSPMRDHYGHDPYDSYGEPYRRPGPPPRDTYERDPYDDPYGESYRDPYREPGLLPPVNQEKIPHDCDIIAIDNQDRSYAKQIEARLRGMKMIANVININDELTLPALMEAANRKKLPYVIVVRRQNEVHHSLTLNILHGAPQEHRNMPYEDAMKLIARNFEAYLIELRAKSARSVTPLVPPPSGRPVLPPTHVVPAAVPSVVAKPEFVLPDSDTHYLLNLLADNRYLTLDELHKVLRYLELRYDRLARSQGVPCHREMLARETLKDETAISKQQEALKKNILSILNGSEEKTATSQALSTSYPGLSGVAVPTSVSQEAGATPGLSSLNLDNPSVQKALDNLISSGSSILKNITSLTETAPSQSHVQNSGMSQPITSQPAALTGQSDVYGVHVSMYGTAHTVPSASTAAASYPNAATTYDAGYLDQRYGSQGMNVSAPHVGHYQPPTY